MSGLFVTNKEIRQRQAEEEASALVSEAKKKEVAKDLQNEVGSLREVLQNIWGEYALSRELGDVSPVEEDPSGYTFTWPNGSRMKLIQKSGAFEIVLQHEGILFGGPSMGDLFLRYKQCFEEKKELLEAITLVTQMRICIYVAYTFEDESLDHYLHLKELIMEVF